MCHRWSDGGNNNRLVAITSEKQRYILTVYYLQQGLGRSTHAHSQILVYRDAYLLMFLRSHYPPNVVTSSKITILITTLERKSCIILNLLQGESPTCTLNEDTRAVIRAIGVSHTACKYEFRQNIRSHNWSEVAFCPTMCRPAPPAQRTINAKHARYLAFYRN